LLPSLWEGFGVILAEAMAFGKPAVAFDVGGAAEVIADGETGLLAPVGDATALATALSMLEADAGLRDRLGRAGRERVRRRYATDAVLDSYEAVYRRCVEGKRVA
jgi:glycosyltransferase involved in cell wall biosynthesis